MKIARITTLVLVAGLTLTAVPALALPPMVPDNPGTGYVPAGAGDQSEGSIPPGAGDQAKAAPPSGAGSHGTDGASNAPSDPSSQGTGNRPATPGPKAGTPAKARAYGKYCDTQSRKRAEGREGTPFSLCVTAMAKVANGRANPRAACRTESRKHVAGEKGTPFSRCVSGAAKLLKDQQESSDEAAPGDDTPTPTEDTDTSTASAPSDAV